MGQKQTFCARTDIIDSDKMSAMGEIADSRPLVTFHFGTEVRFGSEADMRSAKADVR